ncbi:MAG: hypothetical protein IH840_12480 [Candidatus Heimdallarchaeota archaeon]|nr:hypothetical protein [Candidatus Heimdallarchaeota archaeon]
MKALRLDREGTLFTKNYQRKARTQDQALFLNEKIYTVITQLFMDANNVLGGENYRVLPYDMSERSIPLVVPENEGLLSGLQNSKMKPAFFEFYRSKKIVFVSVDMSINSFRKNKSYQIGLCRKITLNLLNGNFRSEMIGDRLSSDSEKLPSKIEEIFEIASHDADLLIILRDNHFLDFSLLDEIITSMRQQNPHREILLLDYIKSGSGAAVGWRYNRYTDRKSGKEYFKVDTPSIFGLSIDQSIYLFHSNRMPPHGMPVSLNFNEVGLSSQKILEELSTPVNNYTSDLESFGTNLMNLGTFLARDSGQDPHPEDHKNLSILKVAHNISRLSDDPLSSFVKYLDEVLSQGRKTWPGNLLL